MLHRFLFSSFCYFLFFLSACSGQPANRDVRPVNKQDSIQSDTISLQKVPPIVQKSSQALLLEKKGLVNVHDLDSTIVVELIYATADNFMKQVLYDDLKEAYLQPDVAKMLVKAHNKLKEQHPELRMIVYDAARPLRIQAKMWNVVKGTPNNIYISNPARPGQHTYGAAVDVSLIDASGTPLDMGTPVDFFGPAAQINNEDLLLKQGKLTSEQIKNRKILRAAMVSAGFKPLRTEWWHFNVCTREEAKIRYKVIE